MIVFTWAALTILVILVIACIVYWAENNSSESLSGAAIFTVLFFFVSVLCTSRIDKQVLQKNIDYQVVCLPVDDTTGVPDKVVIYSKSNHPLLELTEVSAVKAFRVADSITIETPLTIYGIPSVQDKRFYANVPSEQK